jgi:magnesium chelatase subunit H
MHTSTQDIRVVIVTMDTHLASATSRARAKLAKQYPGLSLSMHSASEWSSQPKALERCITDIENGDIVVATMLFLEDHFLPLLPALEAKRDNCDALVCAMSATEVTKLTKMGKFDMSKPASGPMAMLKKLRGDKKDKAATGGAQQMKMLRRLPQMLKFIPGTAQDVRAYFLSLQYWLGGSEDNMVNMVSFLIDRYADGPRKVLRGLAKVGAPVEYPELGVYHPRMAGRLSESIDDLPSSNKGQGKVGILLLRSYLLSGNAGHYDGVVAAMEAKGLQVVPVFAAGLDSRPAIEKYFIKDGLTTVDAVVSLTGFSLVGGPAYNDAKAAEEVLAKLNVPYIAAHPVEFQTLDQWGSSERGLLPVESTIMVAIPELDGAVSPTVFGGRPGADGVTCTGCHFACTFTKTDTAQDMHSCPERAQMLAARVSKLVALRRSEHADRKVAIVLFNFPPNAGNVGTAAFLAVFESLFETLKAMKAQGYTVDLPVDVDAMRDSILYGNASMFGADCNVHLQIPTDDHVKREPWLKEIEAQWGPAPGKQLSNGTSIFVLGKQFGNVLVSVQPAFGYEGDPMRLLFEKGFAPTHAFSAFYRYLREDFNATAVLHFGTHGALEFMPGKQSGMSNDLPNIYLYAANNPSEGALAKRRSGATLVSYLTPPLTQAGLYKGLLDLKASINRWRTGMPENENSRQELIELIRAQALELELITGTADWSNPEHAIFALGTSVLEVEHTLVPHGLHVAGKPLEPAHRIDMLMAMAESSMTRRPEPAAIEALVNGKSIDVILKLNAEMNGDEWRQQFSELIAANAHMAQDTEVIGILQALDGQYIRPTQGGDILRTPAILPTGRNLHGFDPFRIPSSFAIQDGTSQAKKLLERFLADGNALPESIAIVLWGSDNLKTEGSPIAQALALMGAAPRFDSYGRIAGATLIPLTELGRPRIDVVITLSGI